VIKISTNKSSSEKDESAINRLNYIQIIEDYRNRKGFKHYYAKCIDSKSTPMPESEWKKMYSSMNDMDSVIKKFTSYCPNLDVFVPRQAIKKGNLKRAEQQQKLVKRALKKIKWNAGINEVYDTLESKGDNFFYIYFDDENDKMPKLKYLNPYNMKDILLDDNNDPTCYIYKETVSKKVVDELGNVITTYTREVTWKFEIGQTTIIDPVYIEDEKLKIWKPKVDDKGNQSWNINILYNRPSYIDDIAIIRFQSYKKFNEKFSRIPASSYIDHCSSLDIENSNIEIINKMLGFPITYIIGGAVTDGERKPSGFIYVDRDKDSTEINSKPEIVISQINNGLESIFKQIRRREDSLYDTVGLINKTAQEKLGNTDSARVVANYLAPLKNKIELYVDNILNGMELYIKILLKENNLYNEDIDEGITLYKPKHLLHHSVFDEQLYDQNAINLGSETKQEIALEKGDDYEDIKNRIEDSTEDLSINNETANDVRSNNN
jgi:hypothetical protein